jgi:hypothetical protein
MQKGAIKIAANVDYEEYCTFDVTILKGAIETHLHFSGHTDTWKSFGEQLMNFPQNATHEVMFQEGRDEGYGPWFISIKAYCYNHQGHTALHLIMDNQERLPQKCRVEFSILAEAASINNLGARLFNWNVKQQDTITWKAQTS